MKGDIERVLLNPRFLKSVTVVIKAIKPIMAKATRTFLDPVVNAAKPETANNTFVKKDCSMLKQTGSSRH